MEIETVEDLLQEKNEVVVEDYYALSEQTYDDFDEYAHKKGHGYAVPHFPIFNNKLEGMDEGLYVFAGESNSGKTAVVTNIIWDMCKCPENHLFGIYYSLDDSKNEVIARLIAMNQQIPIAVASKPKRYEDYLERTKDSEDTDTIITRANYVDMLNERDKGLALLKRSNKEFYIVDKEKIRNVEELIDHIKKVQTYVKSFNPKNNVIVAIDSIADLVVDTRKFNSDKERIDYISQLIKKTANVDLKVPILGTYHLRKLNHSGRPNLDDVKESGRLVYEASMVFLVFNDVSKNKEGANIFYSEPENDFKQPIIELDWAKNKKSSYKGRTYHYFVPNYSRAVECEETVSRRYDALIYSK